MSTTKNLLTLQLVLLFSLSAFAQEYVYVPFVREGVKWVYSITDYHYDDELFTNPARGDNMIYRTLELRGDTLINGKTYKAMHKCVDDEYSEPNDVVPIYLREEDKRVYGIIPDGKYYGDARIGLYAPWKSEELYSGEEFLLFDFNDPKSFFYDLSEQSLSLNLCVDTIAIGDHLAKRYKIEGDDNGDDFRIIEGLGAMGRNSYPLAFFMPICTGIHCTEWYDIEKIIENGEIIYPQNYVEDRYLPMIREGVKWINEKVTINNGDTTSYYYSYEFKGNAPFVGRYGQVYKALYYTDFLYNAVGDSLIAGMRENESWVTFYNNYALDHIIAQDRNMVSFNQSYLDDTHLYALATFPNLYNQFYALDHFKSVQRGQFLTDENFIQLEPVEIDGKLCSRCAYVKENGDTMCYVVEGIGFDSYDMGDLLTPFTREPDPDADYQEYCGLSHVIKDGRIIYKGMRYHEIYGDVDGDGEVTISDANSVIDIVVMGGNSGHTRTPAADVNGDGEVTIADVNVIIDIILRNH